MGITVGLNIESLRRNRETTAFGARMAFQPNEIFRKIYESEMWPKNTLMGGQGPTTMIEWEMMRHELMARRKDIYTPSREGGRE